VKTPAGMTENEVVESVERVLDTLAKHHAFGIWSEEDIRQYGWEEVLEMLEKDKYDASRPFENFVYVVVRSRFHNLRRNKLSRNDPPCKSCHSGDNCTGTNVPCVKYESWRKRNAAKANVQRPLDLNNIADEREGRTRMESTVVEDLATQELLELIDLHLPIDLRANYLQMRAGVSIPKARRKQIELVIREIIQCPKEEE